MTLNIDLTTISAQIPVSKATIDAANNPEVMLRQELDRLILKVNAQVAADFKENIYWMVEYPASWWQYFKRDVLRPLTDNPSTPIGWWLAEKARSIQYKREEFKREIYTRVCPHIDIPRNDQTHVEWLTWKP